MFAENIKAMIENLPIPEGAQYYLPMKDNKNVASMYYRLHPVKHNDGSTSYQLQYLSFSGSWFASFAPNPDTFISESLIKL